MINIALFGCNGKMGQVIAKILSTDENAKIVFGFDINTEAKNSFPVYDDVKNIKEKADVVIDFSHPSFLGSITQYCLSENVPAVIATTGFSEARYQFRHEDF